MSRSRQGLCLALLAVAAAALSAAVPSPAVAAPAWLHPLDLSAPGQSAEAPQLGAASAGSATALWSRSNGSDIIIQSAVRPPGATWSAPVDLSAPGRDAEQPQLAVDPAGDAIAVWSRGNGGGTSVVQAAARARTGAWQLPVDISAAGGVVAAPQVAINAAGKAAAVWSFANATPTVISASRRAIGAGWLPPITLSVLGTNAAQPQVGLDREGNGLAAWSLHRTSGLLVQAAGLDDAPPQPRLLAIPPAATIRLPATFTVAPFDVWSSLVTPTWTFDDGSIASGATVTHTLSSLGTHTATVVLADTLGNFAGAGGTVTVFPGARAGHHALLRRDRARMRLWCPSPASCRGTVRLFALIASQSARTIEKRRLIGAAPFLISGVQTQTLSVRLTALGRSLVREAGRRLSETS